MSSAEVGNHPDAGHVVGQMSAEASRAFAHAAETGTVHGPRGERAMHVRADWFDVLSQVLTRDATGGPSASMIRECLYQAGLDWGRIEFAHVRSCCEAEYEAALETLPYALVLERWWWPLRTRGFGVLEQREIPLDAQSLVRLTIVDGLMDGDDARGVVHVYEGLFAAAFSELAKRELEAACVGAADERPTAMCFVIGAPSRIAHVRELVAEGESVAEILGGSVHGA